MAVTNKSGWAPLPGGYQRLIAEFPESESVITDKRAWDWTMPAWVVKAYVDMKMEQMLDPSERFKNAVWNRLLHVLGPRARLLTPSGEIWLQNYWGLMKSGWLCTISMNGAAQDFQHVLAWFRMHKNQRPVPQPPMVWAMGDDVIMKAKQDRAFLDEYHRNLATTGCLVKKCAPGREFAGFDVKGDSIMEAVVNPLYPEKHLFHLSYLTPKVETDTLLSYSLIYALSDQKEIPEALKRKGFQIRTLHRVWAKGLAKLDILGAIPDLFSF